MADTKRKQSAEMLTEDEMRSLLAQCFAARPTVPGGFPFRRVW
jgi:hypothetical protein